MTNLRNHQVTIRGITAKRGQSAIGFLPVIALALVLVMVTVNVGQMAQVRVETSNAADAGALAGASWIASGMNEAALVAGKITDAVLMVQAIYLVPFCPGHEQARYANELWYSLDQHPYAPDVVLTAETAVRRGPARYFKEVADDAMWAAWYVGGREWYTAAVNNLMIRFNSGAGIYSYGSSGWVPSTWSYTNDGNPSVKIQQAQARMTTQGAMDPESLGDVDPNTGIHLTWNNELSSDQAMNLTHTTPLDITYPQTAPQLELAPEPGVYYQYEAARPVTIPGIPEPVFTCEFTGWGIRTGYSGDNDPDAPFVLMPDDLLDYGLNPLKMEPGADVDGDSSAADYWAKVWDVRWRKEPPPQLHTLDGRQPYVPSIEHLDELSMDVNGRPALGTCLKSDGTTQYVCGIERRETPLPITVRPVGFTNGNGDVTVGVAHTVETATGTSGKLGFSPVPHLEPRFGGAAAMAKATYDPPQFTFPPVEAKAKLTEAK